ncbi:MAG: pyridoxal-phosphate dependent enzyme [Bacteroidales bacterium]|nr:pyridoxal-phosphate dependent enzyme [Bacteroidales bacterium]
MNDLPSFEEIRSTAERIRPFIHKTPVLSSQNLNAICEADLYFKCENFQRMGAFKMRGAMNALLRLSESEKEVATHSSGNFAQALSLAALNMKIKAFIVMPRDAPEVKKQAVRSYGAEIIECEPGLSSREKALEDVIARTGACFIHPSNNLDVILGNSTSAMELFIETSDLDYLIAPVGGGGLLAGTALSSFHLSPECKVIGGEPFGADDAFHSLETGIIQPSVNPKTIADGLKTSLGDINFPIIRQLVHSIVRVEEQEIIEAMRLIWERMKIVVEPSSAVAFAVILREKELFRSSRTGIILSGGNVDLANLPF